MRFVILFAIGACGGSSPKPVAPPPADPVPMTEPPVVAQPEPTTPVTPPEPTPDPKAELLAAETAAFEKAKPVFDKWCAGCHSKDGKQTSAKKREHFDMTTYPFGGHHAMEISGEIREVLGLTGKKPSMPPNQKGQVKGDDLEAIKAWADAFDASHKGGAHEGHAH
jgi:mono/diheme cytochrome c family protein